MLKPQILAFTCVITAALLGATGQYLIKAATERATSGWLALALSPWVWAGMSCYLTVMVLFSHAFRLGGTVAVLYPLYATTYLWSAFLGWIFYGRPIRAIDVLGMALLVAGMCCLGSGRAVTGS